MLPIAFRVPAAAFFVAAGALATFAGYRLFRVVLGIYGFVLGALAASAIVGGEASGYLILAAILGGVIGALILIGAYFMGVALVGAGLGALAVNFIWAQLAREPHVLIVIAAAVIGALAALALQRYVIIVGTAFGGAWTLIVGLMALLGNPSAMSAAAAGNVWVAYPLSPAPGQRWVPVAWIVLGLIGTTVQLGWTGGERGRVVRRKKKS
jgi:hypothetical protein